MLYRALRRGEDPRKGLHPPEDADPSKTAAQHIAAGSRAKRKSEFISTTRSVKVAAAWAASPNGAGMVVKLRKPQGRESYDMTHPDEARQVFPKMKGTSLNTAKASQEVVIRGSIPAENVLEVWQARTVGMDDYLKADEKKIRSRAKLQEEDPETGLKVKAKPVPVILKKWEPDSGSDR